MIELRSADWSDLETRRQLMALRFEVFVEEQNVPPELEEDGMDGEARHVLLFVEGRPAGCARWRFLSGGRAKVERVAVRAPLRGQGLGGRVMAAVEQDVRSAGVETIVLAAQASAVAFYEARGYRGVGPRFMEAGIEHLRMERDAAAPIC
ncbi:MAG: GNAT family N-acetyltransferase [Myxococcota bacterium]